MEVLLNNRNARILKLIQLLQTEATYVDVVTLVSSLGCDKRTLMNDIEAINTMMPELIEVYHNDDYIQMHAHSIHTLIHIQKMLMNRDIRIQFLLCLFFKPNMKFVEYASILGYSESHLRNQWASINQFLIRFGFEVVQDMKTYQVAIEGGSERTLQVLMSYLAIEAEIKMEDFGISLLSNHMKTRIQDEVLADTFASELKNFLLMYGSICDHRRSIGYACEGDQTLITHINECHQRYALLLMESLNLEKGVTSSVSCDVILRFVNSMVLFIAITSILGAEYSLFVNFYEQFVIQASRDYPHHIESIRKQYLWFSKKAGVHTIVLESIYVYMVFIEVELPKEPLKIGVWTSQGSAHCTYFLNRLRYRLSSHTVVEALEEERYDLIVTNNRLSMNDNHWYDHMIVVSEYLSNRDIMRLLDKIHMIETNLKTI